MSARIIINKFSKTNLGFASSPSFVVVGFLHPDPTIQEEASRPKRQPRSPSNYMEVWHLRREKQANRQHESSSSKLNFLNSTHKKSGCEQRASNLLLTHSLTHSFTHYKYLTATSPSLSYPIYHGTSGIVFLPASLWSIDCKVCLYVFRYFWR